jgi:N utilization substance protein A
MAILDVFRNALKKIRFRRNNFDITTNPDKGDMEIWRRRIIVADESRFENEEITLTEARKIEPDFEIGEDVLEVKLIDLEEGLVLSFAPKG